MLVYLTHPTSRTAHLDIDCSWLTNRPEWCGRPMELEAVRDEVRSDWVRVLRMRAERLVAHSARLCSRCGQRPEPVGWQTSVDPAVVPEQAIYPTTPRRRRAASED